MATKQSISKNKIITLYMGFVLENGENPKSVFSFSKLNKFDEAMFYKHFTSFEAIEKSVFELFFSNTMSVLAKSEDYKNFTNKSKLLSFYFTFFENLTANRSYVIYVLSKYKNDLKGLKILSGLRRNFIKYIAKLEIDMVDLKQDQFDKIRKKTLRESAWIQLLLTIKFWLNDNSPSFDKTDIFIEKSVNASFDVLEVLPIKSVIDLGKFMFKEKVSFS